MKEQHLAPLRDEDIRKLFVDLDVDKSGYLSAEELDDGLKRLRIPRKYRQQVMGQGDLNKDGRLSENEFITYVKAREEDARNLFQRLDLNGDG